MRLADLCAATSLFIDLGTGQPDEHGLRTCLVAMRLAAGLGVGAEACREVFYVSLLRFLGCTADAHQVAELAGGDEIRFLAGMAPVTMGSPREEIARMVGLVAAGEAMPRRLRALAQALTDPQSKQRLLEAHCEVATRLASEMGLPSGVATALAVAYARWDGRGVPADVGGEQIPLSVRVSIVAHDLEVWTRETGVGAARQVLAERRGRAYDPDVIDAALGIGVENLRHSEDELWDVVLSLEPWPWLRASDAEISRALAALGDFADLKLPERSGYARRVTRIASAAGALADLEAREAEILMQAARVHDVGMVSVPTGVWRAPHQPGSAGWEQVRLHPHWSQRILARCPGLEAVATVAGRHHERLDGTGYPSGLAGDLGRPAGLLACVVLLDEKTSGLPFAADSSGAASDMLRLASQGVLARSDVEAVLAAAGVKVPSAPPGRPAGLTEREVEVLGLLARGGTNRQIADALRISAKTVGAHIEHIYTKVGVSSRAAATLFAMQHDLVG